MSDDLATNDNYLVKNARLAVAIELQCNHALGLPVCKTDKKTKLVYLEYADGHIEEIGYATKNDSL